MTSVEPERTCALDSDAFAAVVVQGAEGDQPSPQDLVGTLLDHRYELLERIGSGGMGVVYRARHVKLGRIVAIKVVRVPLRDVATSSKRFENEAMAMARLDHPNCASIIDSGMLGRRAYVVMDFVSGVDLASILDAGPVEPTRAIAIVRQVLAGLAHAHEHGIVHRDIKPANILVTQKPGLADHVKIVDFGLARFREGHTDLTRGLVVGTPSYMAPEQIRGRTIDQRTDVYSCGILLFELLAGKTPFASTTGDALEILTKHITRPVPLLSEETGRPELAPFDAIIARAIAKDPDERYPSVGALSDALTAIGNATAIANTTAIANATATAIANDSASRMDSSEIRTNVLPAVAPVRRRRHVLVASTTLVVAATLAAVAMLVWNVRSTRVVLAEPITVMTVAEQITSGPGWTPAPSVPSAEARRHLAVGRTYFARMWWGEGVKELGRAIALDPSLRDDAELIQIVMKGFVTTARYNTVVGGFLRKELGASAVPELENLARNHRNPVVRARAAAEVRRLVR